LNIIAIYVILESNGEFINNKNKQVGRQRATLPNCSLKMKGISRFTINKNRNSGCGNACIDQGDEMVCKPLPSKILGNEISFYSVNPRAM